MQRFTEETLPSDQTDCPRVQNISDNQIDLSDSPELTPDQLAKAVLRRGIKPKPNKEMLNLRVDNDVLEWWRARGKGYQSERGRGAQSGDARAATAGTVTREGHFSAVDAV